ncbi:MAG: helix-turn-helix transcriptional regulator, partial [Candidatus Phytoplasma sp.]|nr:helix-turn-helix transcriptional regulator [Phytoplasma sp.]
MENKDKIALNIANNIIFYRKELKLTQFELAEKLNYSDKSISKWERGEGIPDIPTL